jgi:hypothetical protein
MKIRPQSAKAKGRRLQQAVRDAILDRFPSLHPDDVRSTSMGASGEDVQLSPAARQLLPITVECKSIAKIAACRFYDQAKEHSLKSPGSEPVVVMRENHGKPLVIVDLDFFLQLMYIRATG